ncbi:DUF4917 family protein [Microbulbifer elongatus]|uniref:DUF4917 family protein n=1 Tax=Microbulbifer elongatus TaxID=86173 RepID=UPI001E301743|nr:DUF4917 family protein [Microbulbifer elongatus]
MITFQHAIGSLDADEKPSIILANGFSQAWNAQIFNYSNLLLAANFGNRDGVIRPLFQGLSTYDFEMVSRHLTAAETVLRAYDPNSPTINEIISDRDVLKDALINAISNTHPDLPSEITDDQYVAVRTFLSQFKEIFSLNYDLLFYWARNKYNLDPENYRTDDGFRAERCWEGHGTDQEVHFLHGGLHIYDTGRYIKKHACTDAGVTIIEQVRDNLQNGNFPLFVSEPTHQKKRQKIDHNPYLNYCFQALGKLGGSLFIHGHSMDENDKHIFDQIKSSRVSKIFVSIFGNEHSPENTRSKANAMAFLQRGGTVVEFYQAESAPVWA